ncbi:MAG: hypothetical protein ABL897_14880 [Hyphomicrobium sp.]
MQKALPSDEELASEQGQQIIERLRAGKLPQMVDWFDPGLLVKVGIRSIISATLGSYTDQRLIQAATDEVAPEILQKRYDYSETGNPNHAIAPDENGAVWVDYIADLGDGFEATYAMAYILAADTLKVDGAADPLPAGKLLIMGGDQVYPDATKAEYHTRLRDPYDWAFSAPGKPQRKLFAIPGNHDWYDGLSAFSALFCSARDRISRGKGVQIGGWRCYQNRSYFAIKLPHNWWIWGPDIQLADNLDDCQRDYFDLMSEQATKGHKIILCIAEPSWLHENYDNMHEISLLARQHGADICAVIAGDWHHYSRYTDTEAKVDAGNRLNIQFITCGGGGAFAHATHGLKPSIDLRWARRKGATRAADARDPTEFNRTERTVIRPEGPDFTLQRRNATDGYQAPAASTAFETPAPSSEPAPEPKPSSDLEAGPQGFKSRKKREHAEDIAKKADSYNCSARAIYPPQWKSRLLCLKNLALPFRNRPFTYLVGIIYFVYAWSFVAADPRQSPIVQKQADAIAAEIQRADSEIYNHEQERQRLRAIASDMAEQAKTDAVTAAEVVKFQTLAAQQDEALTRERAALAVAKKRESELQPTLYMQLSALTEDPKLTTIGAKFKAAVKTSLAFMLDIKALMTAAEQSPMFAFMLLGLWAALVHYVESKSSIVKFVIGTVHAVAHVVTLLFVSWFAQASGLVAGLLSLMAIVPALQGDGLASKVLSTIVAEGSVVPDVARILWNVLMALFLGGLLGGFVMGIYWTLTSTLLNMHTGDAFGALGIKDYKNFLRIKLEPDRATIYPIALDKVPGRRGWRWTLNPGEDRPAHRPLVLPAEPLQPRLIERPIKIDVRVMAD